MIRLGDFDRRRFRRRFDVLAVRKDFDRRQLVAVRKDREERPPLPPDDGIHFAHNRMASAARTAARTQMALAPMATCIQFVPSLMAMHGTEPVPPADR